MLTRSSSVKEMIIGSEEQKETSIGSVARTNLSMCSTDLPTRAAAAARIAYARVDKVDIVL